MTGATLIYDGDCPFCSRYVRLVRLRRTIGPVELVNARSDHPAVAAARDRGLDLDAGMVLVLDGVDYHGDACLSRLALLSSRSDLFNRITFALFRRPAIARWAYPILRAGRNATLRLLGRPRLEY